MLEWVEQTRILVVHIQAIFKQNMDMKPIGDPLDMIKRLYLLFYRYAHHQASTDCFISWDKIK
jgi:hypothetical protein